jgi:hypothetical protein
MKKISGFAVLAVFIGLSGCDWFAPPANRPPIPTPDSYIAEVPLKSDELIVSTVPLDEFNPTVTNAKDDEGNNLIPVPVAMRVPLMLNGNPSPDPTFDSVDTLPLENMPQLQLVRYWQRLGPVRRYSGATTTTVEQEVTRGTKSTTSLGFGFTIGVETTVGVDAILAKTSLTVKAEFSGEFETEYEITESTTETETYEVSAEQEQNLVFVVWQLVEEYRIVIQDGSTWVTYTDPHYEFLDTDLAPLVVPADDIRKISYPFPNTPRIIESAEQ